MWVHVSILVFAICLVCAYIREYEKGRDSLNKLRHNVKTSRNHAKFEKSLKFEKFAQKVVLDILEAVSKKPNFINIFENLKQSE